MPKEYTVTWHVRVAKIRYKGILSLGICEYGDGVAFEAVHRLNGKTVDSENLKILLIHFVDIYEDGSCDDAEHCLNLKCPKNRTTAKSFNWIKSRKHLERTHRNLEFIRHDLKLTVEPRDVRVEYKQPKVYRLMR